MDIAEGKKMLSAQGLDMLAVLSVDMLPAAFNTAVQQINLRLQDYSSLVLIGHSGNLMWQRLKDQASKGNNPVDEFSLFHAGLFVERYLDGCRHAVLYPGEVPIPLQQLGALAGWHHRSPLGLGINRIYGPWFGYRVVLLVRADLPLLVDPPGVSPCEACAEKPCINACPAHALSDFESPNISVCVDYRMQDKSPCERQCFARLACPVGAEFRYSKEQLHYFYGRSLVAIKTYIAKQEN